MNTQIIELAEKLISIPSETQNKKELEKIIRLCEKELVGFTIERFEKNGFPSLLIYSAKKRPAKFKIILNAHLDVVPAQKDQYNPQIKGNKMYGRGTIDMKAAAAAQIFLFKNLAKKVDYPLGLQLVTDEETGGFNGTKYQIEQGVRAEFVIAGEPTDFGINNQAKGIMWIKILLKGTAAHAAYPWNGDNAIQKMNEFLTSLLQLYPIPKKESWQTTVNISKIDSNNNATNKVPDDCTATLDVRFVPEDKNKIMHDIKTLLPKDAEIEILTQESVHDTKSTNPYIKILGKSIQLVTNAPSHVIQKHGGSDVRFYNEAGMDGITFGPIGQGLHSDKEWVDTKSLILFYKTLESFLLSL